MKPDHVDVAVLWELLHEQGGRYAIGDLAELALGDQGAAACRAVEDAIRADRVRFRDRKGLFEPRPAESVAEALLQQRLADERTGRRAAALDEVRAALSAGRAADWARVGEELRPIEELAIHGDLAPVAVREAAEALLKELARTRGGPWAAAVRTLVALGRFDEDENLLLLRHRISTRFPESVLADAQTLAGASPASDPARLDRTRALTVAIDDAETDEVDDALSVEARPDGGWRIEVHIADASAWVPAGSAVDAEAARRGATLYLPDRRIPMVPPVLAYGGMSLVEGQDRAALTFAIDLDAAGRVLAFEPRLTVVRVDFQLPYEEVDSLLDTRSDTPLGGALRALFRLSEDLRRERVEAGALEVQPPEVKVRVGADGVVRVTPLDRYGPSRRLVAEWMIQAGRLAARWCGDRGVPAVYRRQDPPDDPPPDMPREGVVDSVAFHGVVRGLRKAVVSTQPGPHWGLGAEAYTQVTSPIRRYADLVMHRQIKARLAGLAPLPEEQVLAAVASADEAGDVLSRIERETHRYYILKYLSGLKGGTQRALVIAPRDRGRWLIELEDVALQATVALSGQPQPRDVRTVEILAVGARDDRLQLREVETPAPPPAGPAPAPAGR